jgi:glycosyltransferase involved in cell wall biosynthesis
VVCPTETVKSELLSWGVKKPIEAVSNGVDLERFFSYADPKELYLKFHLPPNPLVLYVGRLDRDKNLKVLIEVISKLDKSINAHFVMVGGGDSSKDLQKMATKKNIQNQISFLGEVSHNSPDLPLIYQAASLFVIPAAHETQSKVTMEAMAAGLPIIGANSGALPELVSHNKNGFLFEPKSSDDLARKISEILKNQKLRKKMSKNSLEMITKHNLEKSIEKFKKIYAKLLDNCQKK